MQTLVEVSGLDEAIERVVLGLNKTEERARVARGYTLRDSWHVEKKANKFVYVNCGGSGAFLVERSTGAILNIMGYGKPDYNKAKKAPLGTVFYVDTEWLWGKRYNYLRG